MEVKIYDTPDELGLAAASFTADLLNRYITDQGYARLLLSTGASQLSTLGALVQLDVDWSRVEAPPG
ncbi:hypothetical protein GCM10025859_06850 [Alicyclobacillus fastidiosus]|nr:hypothetical protein GCM10025859_06850 [Alicyclobacillus fastidiosus]